ncbi:hypothetical protein SDC9_181241 [bioreactor metagenome]|uniref:Uncharacterized protein n=1 Tax=bioreactor metagenome TaxID=1076179 RepID=A0A645H4Y7_9ZZZZ
MEIFAQNQAAVSRCHDLARKYSTALSYQIQMNVKMHSEKKDSVPIQSFTAILIKSGRLFYREAFDQIVVLTKDGVALLIDKSNLNIQMEKPDNEPIETPVSSLSDEKMAYNLISSTDGETVIETGAVPAFNIEKIRITVDNKTELISKVEYYYQDSEEIVFRKVVVDFLSTSLNSKQDDSVFELKKYVKKAKGDYFGTGSYTGYKVEKRY